MAQKTLADKFPNFAAFWSYLSKRQPAFISTNPFKEQLTAQWFSSVHYYYRAYTAYWPEEEEFISRFSALIYAQYASICKKEKLYQQIYPRLNQLWKVKTTSRNTTRGENTRTTENYDKPLFESPDYLISNYGTHGRASLVKNYSTTTEKTKSDTGVINKDGKLVYNFTETEDRRGISQVLGHFRELDTIVMDYLNAKEVKVLFLFVRGVPEITWVYDPTTGKKRTISKEEAEEAKEEAEKTKPAEHPEEEDDPYLPTLERLARFKKKQERLKKIQMGIVQGKIALRIEHIERIYEGFNTPLKMPPLGSPTDTLPDRGSKSSKEWKEVLDKATFWAIINQVVGFEEAKKSLALYVKLFEDSIKEGYELNQLILLLCGKPGTGKTFFATVIAEALNRPLMIVGMNGLKNTNTFLGTEQEIPGSDIGEILKAMSNAKHQAPVVLLDEFEKSDKAVQYSLGNPTDKTINQAFKDKFFGLPIPIQNVIFVATANYQEQIEPFIASRMTPINLIPLSFTKRMEIAHKEIAKAFGRYKVEFAITKIADELLKKMIDTYKEWGVRKLKENIANLALQIRALFIDKNLPTDYNSYKWHIPEVGVEVDGKCPFAKDRTAKHLKICDCFNGKEVEGWEDAFGTYKFEIRE